MQSPIPKKQLALSRDSRAKRPSEDGDDAPPSLAAIEAGTKRIEDHLEYFSKSFRTALRSVASPPLSIDGFGQLYRRNQHRQGHHFVVHQHDHPVSGIQHEAA